MLKQVQHDIFSIPPTTTQPLAGGGLRGAWIWQVPPSPLPSPARGEGNNGGYFIAIFEGSLTHENTLKLF